MIAACSVRRPDATSAPRWARKARRSPIDQHLEIAARLRGLDDAEGVLAARHQDVGRIVGSNLQEHPAVGSAFVGLAGGVQKARSEFEATGRATGIADRPANRLQQPLVRRVHLDVGEQGEVVAGLETVQVRFEVRDERPLTACALGQDLRVGVVGEEIDAFAREDWRLCRHTPLRSKSAVSLRVAVLLASTSG